MGTNRPNGTGGRPQFPGLQATFTTGSGACSLTICDPCSGAFYRERSYDLNGSPYYPTKVPDLIGVGERKFIDHTATHRLRNSGDLMRYAVMVGCCDSAEFGPHRRFSDTQRRITFRYPDEVLFALAGYIYSLKPPPNPNRNDPRIRSGKQIFAKAGCAGCHTPPLYTNNKLTLAEGFTPPRDHALAPTSCTCPPVQTLDSL